MGAKFKPQMDLVSEEDESEEDDSKNAKAFFYDLYKGIHEPETELNWPLTTSYHHYELNIEDESMLKTSQHEMQVSFNDDMVLS